MEMRCNDFLDSSCGLAAIIALNSPTLGKYEATLLRRIVDSNCRQGLTCPLIICTDGAYKRLHEFDAFTMVDVVIGDMDSWEPHIHHYHFSSLSLEALQTISFTTIERPMVIKVDDQNTTDFEKSLQFLMAIRGPTAIPFPMVLVLGCCGGEWHHEVGALHVAAKFSSFFDLRLHSRWSTMMCCPHGITQFRRHPLETDAFGVIPFGVPPLRAVTRGLRWELNVDRKKDSNLFGWSSESHGAYISTSNRIIHPDGVVEIELEYDGPSAVFITSNVMIRREAESHTVHAATNLPQYPRLPRVGWYEGKGRVTDEGASRPKTKEKSTNKFLAASRSPFSCLKRSLVADYGLSVVRWRGICHPLLFR